MSADVSSMTVSGSYQGTDGPIESPAAWYGPDMTSRSEWVFSLTAEHLAEIDAALRVSERNCARIIDITTADFPLPTLGPKLLDLRADVMDGRAFTLIRRIPVDSYSKEEAARIYFGIGAHLGSLRSQNGEGHVLGHVCDVGHDHHHNDNQRGYRAPGKLEFHTDSVDIVGLFCLRPAMKGGASKIVSSITVHNEIWKRRPDLAPLMFEPIYRDRRGEVPEGKDPWWIMPIFQWYGGRLFSHYSGTYIRSAQRFDDVPRFTEAQLELLDLIDEIMNDPAVFMRMEFGAGDMQFLCNHHIFHARDSYEDWPEPERRRYLLRLWVCPPDGPSMPPSFAERYGTIDIGDRGGIIVPGTRLQAPLTPI